MTNTTDDIPMTTLKAQAEELGQEHGRNSASWVEFDETSARLCLKLDEDGDPEWDDKWGVSGPLSGEWADSLTPRKLVEDELGLDPETVSDVEEQEICDAYEQAFTDERTFAVLRAARQYLAD